MLTSTPGLPWLELSELSTSSDFAPGDHAGQEVAISGDTLVVSSHKDDDIATDSGAAYVFLRNDNGTPNDPQDDDWLMNAKLTSDDASFEDEFGRSVDIDGDTIVVGANQLDKSGNGAAYVFQRSGNSWSQAAKLEASDGAAGDRFGNHVAVEGDTIVVSALGDDDLGDESGSAYVYIKPTTGWAGTITESQKLLASDGSSDDRFGREVDISGGTIVVGADQRDNGGNGKAYIFDRDDNGTPTIMSDDIWLEQSTLLAQDGAASDQFGMNVAISGTTIVIAAIKDDHANVVDAGSAYVFDRDDGGTPNDTSDDSWLQVEKLTASDPGTSDQFGRGIAVDDQLIVVGAWSAEIGVADSGAVYFYQLDLSGNWTEQGKVTASDAKSDNNFGSTKIALQGDTLVVGDPQHDHNGIESGGAFVFVNSTASVVASDIFESGSFSGGLGSWAGSWSVSGDTSIQSDGTAHSGNGHVRLRRGNGLLQRSLDVTNLSDLKLRFWSMLSSFEGSDQARVQVSGDGANWVTLKTFSDGEDDDTYRRYDLPVPNLGNTLSIRFDADMNRTNDFWFIDDVEVIGSPVEIGNQAPQVSAGPDQTLSDDDGSGVELVALTGSATDSDGSVVSYEWSEGTNVLGTAPTLSVSLPVGVHTLTLSATDNEGEVGTDSVTVTVLANQGPTADAGSDQVVTDADSSGSEVVNLNGSGTDSDGTIVAYEWKEGSTVLGNTASISPNLSVGTHVLTLTVTDNGGATATADVTIDVREPAQNDPNALYVYDIRFESRKRGRDHRAVFEIRSDDDAGGTAGDLPVAGASIQVTFAGNTYTGTTDSNGIFRTDWKRLSSGNDYYANAVDLALSGYTWNPFDIAEEEDDSDGDGRPDDVLQL